MPASTANVELLEPADQEQLVETVRDALAADQAIYPYGGGTTRHFGMPAKRPGYELSTVRLDQVVDYPSRDMTITVEAGITIEKLADILAAECQRLPVDAAEADSATLGGLIASNFSGPRRFGCGTIRDYVIGISAVDGRGTPFKAGGRVVKNVAGYDFCKLLCGSLGTLAVITQATLKLKPIPEADAFVVARPKNLKHAETLLAALNVAPITPSAVELLSGWSGIDGTTTSHDSIELLVGLEGSQQEVDWMAEQLTGLLTQLNADVAGVVTASEDTHQIWSQLTEFGASASDAPLVVKCNVRPSDLCNFMTTVTRVVPQSRIQAHAGDGAVIVVVDELPKVDAAKLMVQHLRPAAQAARGHANVWSHSGDDLTRQAMWGPPPSGFAAMQAVKNQFDPKNLLNPGRYYFP